MIPRINISEGKLRLIASTLYRAYSLPYKRKVYDDGTRRDDTYEQTEKEKDLMRRTALVLDYLIERKKRKKAIVLSPFKYYKGVIKYHRTDDLRPESLSNGSEVHLKALWIAGDDERFAGDMIFQPAEQHHWLPERDLEIRNEITFEEFIRKLFRSFQHALHVFKPQ